jgi:hypothetical protein
MFQYAKEGDARNWWVYHDALSQITDKECVAYMTEQKYYDHLIKPELGCNAGTIYEGRLVGNSPELNPLDCSLFADLSHALTLHICLTEKMDKDDIRKFSTATSAKIEWAVDRLFSPATADDVQHPSSDRIKGDIYKIQTSLRSIIEADGTMLDGIGNRNGHRVRDTSNAVNEASKRGGARQAGVSKFPHKNEKFRHSHVNGVSGHFLQESKVKFEQYLKDGDAEDYESDVSVDTGDIFTVREKFTRKSKTAGAMREPLRTLTSQANMNKFVEPGASNQNSLVQLRSCTKVGDMYECPYCSKSFNATQGVKKAYNRHLSTKACQNKRVSLGAYKRY